MKDNTLRGEIENILDSKVDGLPSQKLAVEKLEALLADEVRKAVKKELENINKHSYRADDGDTAIDKYIVEARITELEKEGKSK